MWDVGCGMCGMWGGGEGREGTYSAAVCVMLHRWTTISNLNLNAFFPILRTALSIQPHDLREASCEVVNNHQ